jgi:hypothetical protein
MSLALLQAADVRADLSSSLGALSGGSSYDPSGGSSYNAYGFGLGGWNYCPSPSLTVCQQESGQTDACSQQNYTNCVGVLQGEFQNECQNPASYGGVAANPIFPDGSPLPVAGSATPGMVLPYDQSRLGFHWNGDTSFAAQMTTARLPSRLGLSVVAAPLTAAPAPLHPQWEANGGAITPGTTGGCAEYAYEKYYDYQRFEDAAASCLNDYMCIYNLGTMTTNPGINEPQLMKRDGTVMTDQIPRSPVDQPKNAFLALDPLKIFGVLRQIGEADSPDAIAANDALNAIRASLAPSAPSGYTGDGDTGFNYHFSDRFAWHQAMHDAQLPESLGTADYRSMEDRQLAYSQLVDQFQAIFDAMSPDQKGALQSIYNGATQADCGGNTTTGGVPAAGQGSGDCPWCPVQQDPSCTYSLVPAQFPYGSDAQHLQQIVFQMAHALLAEWAHRNPYTGVVDHGCLDPNSARCDWEPKMFARDYVGLFQKDVEADYKHCIADTGDNLTLQPPNSPDSLLPTPANLADTASFEAYLAWLEWKYGEMTKDLPKAGPAAIGSDMQGGHTFGDPSWFAAGYSYGSYWSSHFQGTGVVCTADAEIRNSLKAWITLLNNPLDIVDASFDFSVGQDGSGSGALTTWFKVFGSDLYDPINGQPTAGAAGEWNVSPSKSINEDNLVQFTCPVAGIPFTVTAGFDAQFGAVSSTTFHTTPGCILEFGDPSTEFLRVGGGFKPYAALNGSVGASVDAGVASAGIDAHLNLITVSLPMHSSVWMNYGGENNGAQVGLDASAELELSELSGRVDVYLDVNLGITSLSVDREIFSWDGLHQGIPLMKPVQNAYPLQAINYWVNNHAN